MTTLKLDITKKELENRIHTVLETAMKSPITKKRKKLVNAAMVQILHGGNNNGQNEHNLDKFFGTPTSESVIICVGFLNILDKNKKIEKEITFDYGSRDSVYLDIYDYIFNYCSDQYIDYDDYQEYLSVRDNSDFIKKLKLKNTNKLTDNKSINSDFIVQIKKESHSIQRSFITYLAIRKHYEGRFYVRDISSQEDSKNSLLIDFESNDYEIDSSKLENAKKENIANIEKDKEIKDRDLILINTLMQKLSYIVFYNPKYFDSINSITTFFKNNGYELSHNDIKIINTKTINEDGITARGIDRFYRSSLYSSELKLNAMFLYLKESARDISDPKIQKDSLKYLGCLSLLLK